MLRATGTESTVVHVTVSFVPALVVTSGLPGTWREQRRGVDIVQDSVWSIYPKGLSHLVYCLKFLLFPQLTLSTANACHDRQVTGGGRYTPVRALGHAVVTATALG